MSTQVTLNGSTFNIPNQGENPPWGEELTDLLVELVEVSNSSVGTADVLLTSFTVANNQSSAANVTGASFDTSQVRSFIMQYSIYRSTSTNELSEVGHLYGTYKSTAGTWDLAQTYSGSSGVTFTITSAGQIQYTSTNVSGSSYSGKMKFKATAFLQA
jgi:hypothetical protein